MSSNFEYVGLFNNCHEFKEISTGVTWRLPTNGVDSPSDKIVMLDDDVVSVENSRGERTKFSIRNQQVLGTDYF